jgi:predicted small secreted protein
MTLRLIALAILAAALPGCNTMQGFGQDVEAAGEAIQNQFDQGPEPSVQHENTFDRPGRA